MKCVLMSGVGNLITQMDIFKRIGRKGVTSLNFDIDSSSVRVSPFLLVDYFLAMIRFYCLYAWKSQCQVLT